MPRAHIVRESSVIRSGRVIQVEGIFDIPLSEKTTEAWEVDFTLPEVWNIGLIVGPSGSGKTTIAKEIFGDAIAPEYDWDEKRSLVDGFPRSMGIREITEVLSSVGFSSPPSWLKPYHALSNGEQFRVKIARTMAEMPQLFVIDEFTSVVDRTVARIGSAAISKSVRRRQQQFVAVTCHYDVAEWLEPDWVYRPDTGEFISGRCLQRPKIKLEIRQVHHSAWRLFRKHHYLNTDINPLARCFVAFWDGIPVAFTAVLYFPHPTANGYREHRTVCLPDYQGVGIGNALSEFVASLYPKFSSTTGNPAMIRHRNKSPLWAMTSKPSINGTHTGTSSKIEAKNKMVGQGAASRLTAGFRYIGPKNTRDAVGFGIMGGGNGRA